MSAGAVIEWFGDSRGVALLWRRRFVQAVDSSLAAATARHTQTLHVKKTFFVQKFLVVCSRIIVQEIGGC